MILLLLVFYYEFIWTKGKGGPPEDTPMRNEIRMQDLKRTQAPLDSLLQFSARNSTIGRKGENAVSLREHYIATLS